MEINLIKHIIYGFLAALTDILPVSARAHTLLMQKVLGWEQVRGLPLLLIHIGILLALYTYSRVQLIKMSRARKLSRIPKKKRKRPLDIVSLMDSRFLFTMSIPLVLVLLAYDKISLLPFNLIFTALFLFVNGIILYVPQFLPGSNRDARSLSRVDGLLMGFGQSLAVIPGFSGVAAAVSVASVCGVERTYALNMSIMLNLVYMLGLIVYDVITIISIGPGVLSATVIIAYILAAAAAYISTMLGIRIMRTLASASGYHFFAYYCWGLAILAFILNLMA